MENKGKDKKKYKLKLNTANRVRKSITRKNTKEVVELYKELSKEIRKDIQNRRKKNINRFDLRKLGYELEKEIRRLNENIKNKTKTSMKDVSSAVIKDVNGFLRNSGFRPEQTFRSFDYIPTDVVRNVLSGNVYNRKDVLNRNVWKNLDKTEKDIRKIIAKGIARGRDTYDIAKDLEKYVNPKVRKDYEWSKMYPGTNKVVDYNAQRLVRTMVSHAYQQSMRMACDDNPFVVGYKWITADLHGRTCELCKERAYEDHHGLGVGVFPKSELPLDHPNGFCEFEPVMFGSEYDIMDVVEEWYESPRGTYPEIDRYVDLFRR